MARALAEADPAMTRDPHRAVRRAGGRADLSNLPRQCFRCGGDVRCRTGKRWRKCCERYMAFLIGVETLEPPRGFGRDEQRINPAQLSI
jgi:hypothetical protein